MTNVSKKMLTASTLVWGILLITAGILIRSGVRVSDHFSFEVLLEFSKSISIWYISAILCAFAIDIDNKKRR